MGFFKTKNNCNEYNELLKYKTNISNLLELDKFLLYVDNWEVCDTIKPRIFKKDLKKVYDNINIFLEKSILVLLMIMKKFIIN